MRRSLAAIFILFFAHNAFAAPLDAQIDKIIKGSRLSSADVSVYAISEPGGKILAEINPNKLLNPASCMKLLTTAVALKTFGPDYQFPTNFYLNSAPATDLWVKGFGDPAFVIERLEEAVQRLIAAGLPVAIRDIYIDDSYFESWDFPGRQKGSSRSYNAMTSAVALNHGAITVEVFPAEQPGKKAIVEVDAPGLIVKNQATTSARRSRSGIGITRKYAKEGDTIIVTGRISVSAKPVKKYLSVTVPTQHFGTTLKALLEARGVNVAGEVKFGTVPANASLLYVAKSSALSEVLKNMNKNSSNFMAEQIVKSIGAKVRGAPGTTEKGVQVFEKYLRTLGINDFYVENGSGLSYKNHIATRSLVAVMVDMFKDARLKTAFIESLSIAGVDGTTKKWNSPVLFNKLYAKTGSLNGVSTLAGFMPKKGETIIFSIILNGGRVSFTTGRNVSQRIVEALAEGQ